jgi:hypothetical protein
MPVTDDRDGRYEREPTTRIPRWVKVAGIVVAVLALLVVIAMLVGGGAHGPGRHF